MLDGDEKWVSRYASDTCASEMSNGLIANFNSRVKPEDTVIHVGDFCCKGRANGVEGSRSKSHEWRDKLNGNWIFVEGNHDSNNGLKFGIDTMVLGIGGLKAFVQHRPIETAGEIPEFCDFVICGHVHEKWGEKLIDGVWNINVGVDARKYYPIDDSELVGIFKHVSRAFPEGEEL